MTKVTNFKLEKVLRLLKELEEDMNVSIISRGGAYGSAKLIIRDNKTEEELVRE